MLCLPNRVLAALPSPRAHFLLVDRHSRIPLLQQYGIKAQKICLLHQDEIALDELLRLTAVLISIPSHPELFLLLVVIGVPLDGLPRSPRLLLGQNEHDEENADHLRVYIQLAVEPVVVEQHLHEKGKANQVQQNALQLHLPPRRFLCALRRRECDSRREGLLLPMSVDIRNLPMVNGQAIEQAYVVTSILDIPPKALSFPSAAGSE